MPDYLAAGLSGLLALTVLIVPLVGLVQRMKAGKGIGWQFIRFNVIVISLPVAALLALNDALTGEVSTIIAAAMAYAFGKSSE